MSHRLRRLFAIALASFVAAVLLPAAAASPAQAATSGGYFYGAYVSLLGSRDYHGYVPSSYRPGTPMPLLVALHGCTENDVGFDVLSGWSAEAERRGFIVVFPDQSNFVNAAGCWNWYLPTNQHRGFGEPAIIAGITNKIRSQYTVDSSRVYTTGVSAGGVMTNILAVTYPDVSRRRACSPGASTSATSRRRVRRNSPAWMPWRRWDRGRATYPRSSSRAPPTSSFHQ